MVFIGNNKNGLLPFGIHLREEDTLRAVSSVNNRDIVTWNSRTNSIELPQLAVSLGIGKSFRNELATLNSTEIFKGSFEQISLEISKLESRTGLDVSIHDFLTKYIEGSQDWHGAETNLVQLIEAVESNEESSIEEVLRYFLGRGQGLTPSGDDMVVGLLAFDAVSHFLPDYFYQKVSELIENESITTDVAREYIRYALKQEYSSTVSGLLNALAVGSADRFDEVFYDLVGVGHSSGMDTLLGILLGMLIYRNRYTRTETN